MPLPATCNVFEINAASAEVHHQRSGCALYKSTPAELPVSPPRLVLASLFPSEWNTMEEEGGEGVRLLGVRRSRGGKDRDYRSAFNVSRVLHVSVSSVMRLVSIARVKNKTRFDRERCESRRTIIRSHKRPPILVPY